jgi:hypothetical protein
MKESKPPLDLHECLAILILRVLPFTQEDVGNLLRHSKLTVKIVEDWFGEVTLREAQIICNDQSLKEKAEKIIVKLEDLDKQTAMRVAKISPEDILQHYRATEYLESKAEKLLDNPRLLKHFDQLAQTAEVLAHNVQRLLRYTDKEVVVHGNIIEGLFFFMKTPYLETGSIEPLEEYEYEKQHPVDSYLADCLFAHYENECGKLTFKSWKEVGEAGKENATQELFKDLVRLSHSERIRFCPTCPSCKDIASS